MSVISMTFDKFADVFVREYMEGSVPRVEREVPLYEGLPCAISRARVGSRYAYQPIKQTSVPTLEYEVKLFADPGVKIPAGCKIMAGDVTYISCGEAIEYDTHIEVLLSREDFA